MPAGPAGPARPSGAAGAHAGTPSGSAGRQMRAPAERRTGPEDKGDDRGGNRDNTPSGSRGSSQERAERRIVPGAVIPRAPPRGTAAIAPMPAPAAANGTEARAEAPMAPSGVFGISSLLGDLGGRAVRRAGSPAKGAKKQPDAGAGMKQAAANAGGAGRTARAGTLTPEGEPRNSTEVRPAVVSGWLDAARANQVGQNGRANGGDRREGSRNPSAERPPSDAGAARTPSAALPSLAAAAAIARAGRPGAAANGGGGVTPAESGGGAGSGSLGAGLSGGADASGRRGSRERSRPPSERPKKKQRAQPRGGSDSDSGPSVIDLTQDEDD